MIFIKRFLFISFLSFLLIEISLRVFFAFKIGPDILFYGTMFNHGFGEEREWKELVEHKQSVAEHSNIVKNYSKYFPYQKRFDYDPITREVFSVTINSKGFRGKDFEVAKSKGVLRIATLGGSSTFGYGDRDNQTYSYYLEEILRTKIRKDSLLTFYKDVEVINFGVPHLTSDKILSLFVNEVIPCQPDIVTFYEGVNDASQNVRLTLGKIEISRTTFFGMLMKKVKERLLIIAVAWEIMKTKTSYPRDYYRVQLAGKCNFIIDNLLKIRDICLKNNIKFVIITQQAKSCTFDTRNLKYSDEVNLLEKKLMNSRITYNELCFLIHNRIMAELKDWTAKNNVHIVNGIEVLDDHRSCLTSWVHLTPRGNRILAAAIADKIYAIK